MPKRLYPYLLGLAVVVVLGVGIRWYFNLPPQQPSIHRVSYQGVSFASDTLASSVSAELVPAQPYTEPQPGGSGNPPFIRFSFDGESDDMFYPPSGKYLLVYPTEGYQAFLTANDFSDSWSPQTFQQLLDQKPTNPSYIPIAPVPTGSQVFRAKVQYLDFTGGQGVSFITSYAQDVSPITNQELLYTFQGLTSDGKYWVSFFYPLHTSELPDTYEDAGITDYMAFANAFTNYLTTTTAKLDVADPSTFTPNLNELDNLVQSISVNSELNIDR